MSIQNMQNFTLFQIRRNNRKKEQPEKVICQKRMQVNSWYPYSNFVKKKLYYIFETLKPNSQEMAKNFEKRILQMFHRITFFTYIPVNPYHFIKKHHNRCTLGTPHSLDRGTGTTRPYTVNSLLNVTCRRIRPHRYLFQCSSILFYPAQFLKFQGEGRWQFLWKTKSKQNLCGL